MKAAAVVVVRFEMDAVVLEMSMRKLLCHALLLPLLLLLMPMPPMRINMKMTLLLFLYANGAVVRRYGVAAAFAVSSFPWAVSAAQRSARGSSLPNTRGAPPLRCAARHPQRICSSQRDEGLWDRGRRCCC